MNHDIFPDLPPNAQLTEKTGLIEKSWLSRTSLKTPDHLYGLLDKFVFFQISGGRVMFEKREELFHLINFDSHFISALYNQNIPLIYVIDVVDSRISLFMGTNSAGAEVLAGLLEANIGTRLIKRSTDGRGYGRMKPGAWAALTGLPHKEKRGRKQDFGFSNAKNGIDFLISGLIKKNWTYIIQAFPISSDRVQLWLEGCAREIKDIKEKTLLTDIQKSNRMAAYYVDILEKSLSRLKTGKLSGVWQTGVYLLAESPDARDRGRALLSTVFSGSKVGPEPIRTHICRSDGDCAPFMNCYNSNELTEFITLPEHEYPGYRLHEHVMFDVDFTDADYFQVSIGKVTDDRHTYGQDCAIALDDLSKHAIVAGVTGSGKTNTVFQILLECYRKYKIPFLVIEPAKSEYRNLLGHIDGLNVFTLGEERPGISAPFRFNPFAFDTGVSIQTHIDYLKAVFYASFAMYAPMPYILEECFYKIYEEKGWNLVASTNSRGYTGSAFPTLKDLYHKIDEVVDRAGYDDRLTMDIKSALKTRIKNLCIGAKGRMLNTTASIPISTIMSSPTVLELKYMGSDEEKAFMMGLILIAIGEYHDGLRNVSEEKSSGLQHLTVIEEAHRLLKNVSTEKVSEDLNNIKGKGLETFTNLLAEIREYGEGIIVAEQIPVKLAPEVMKNCNLKIMHRIVATEDRDVMGGTMNLDERQKRHAATLNAADGEAIFFREGLDRPLKIRIPLSDIKMTDARITGKRIHDEMHRHFYSRRPDLLELMPACPCCPDNKTPRCEEIRMHEDMTPVFQDGITVAIRIFLPFILNPAQPDPLRHIGGVVDANRSIYYCAMAHLIDAYLFAKGNYFRWPYAELDDVRQKAHAAVATGKFAENIAEYCRDKNKNSGPSSICTVFCARPCLLGFEISEFIRDPHLHNRFVHILNAPGSGDELYENLAGLLHDFFREFIGPEQNEFIRDLSLCYVIKKLEEQQFTLGEQKRFIERFIQAI